MRIQETPVKSNVRSLKSSNPFVNQWNYYYQLNLFNCCCMSSCILIQWHLLTIAQHIPPILSKHNVHVADAIDIFDIDGDPILSILLMLLLGRYRLQCLLNYYKYYLHVWGTLLRTVIGLIPTRISRSYLYEYLCQGRNIHHTQTWVLARNEF